MQTLQKTVIVTKGNTSNLFQHITEYEQHMTQKKRRRATSASTNTSIYKCYKTAIFTIIYFVHKNNFIFKIFRKLSFLH